jgi:hypothetical protein
MGIALELYVDDNGAYPYYMCPTYPDNPDLAYYTHWSQVLRPYWQHEAVFMADPMTNEVFNCPGYKGVTVGGDAGPTQWFWSYAYNAAGVRFGSLEDHVINLGLSSASIYDYWAYGAPGPPPPWSATRIVAPSELFAIMDSQEGGLDSGGPGGLDAIDWVYCNGYNPLAGESFANLSINVLQHGKFFNAVCCDAHVSAIPIATLFNLTNSAANWTIDHQPHPELWPPD